MSIGKKVAKNTLFLYARMFIMMIVSLYTSRVILNALGVEDFGIYNIIGGLVVLFSILNGALTSSTQRFLNFETGKGNTTEILKILKNSIALHGILVILVLVIAETVGLWYVNNVLNVPNSRLCAANYVYHFTVLTFVVNIMRVPFNALIIANERMQFYAIISVLEALLKLSVAIYINNSVFDKLIVYSGLLSVLTVIVAAFYLFYSRFYIESIKLGFGLDKPIMKKMVTFSGWSLLGSLALVLNQQGMNLLLNYYFGVPINAAVGVAMQVTGAMYAFIANFQIAFNPQIVKLYAQGSMVEMRNLVKIASKFSFLLFWFISLPVFFASDYLITLWLGQTPDHVVSFCNIIIIYLLVDSMNGPLWTSINATGEIKVYQIVMSSVMLLNLPIGWLLLLLCDSPEIVWSSRIMINIIAMTFRLWFLEKKIDLSRYDYIIQVVLPVVFVSFISLSVLFVLPKDSSLKSFLIILFASIIVNSIVIYFVGLKVDERIWAKNILMNVIHKILKK